MPLSRTLAKLRERQNLSTTEAQAVFDTIFAGDVPQPQIVALLQALHEKGETADELRGAVQSMRGKMIAIEAPAGAIDIVGTGGDGKHTFNVSTAVALVVAACGVPVAKHGNRAASSKAGSSDVLAALGVNLNSGVKQVELCLQEANLCFLFAPLHHPAMRHVTEARRQLKTRTIFNLLGPLTNPASVKRHLIGVYASNWLKPMAEVLQSLGSERAWLTHGQDGIDELTTTAPTEVIELNLNSFKQFMTTPEQAGLAQARPEQLTGGDAATNAQALRDLLQGRHNAYRDIVLLNSAAALIVAGAASDLPQGVKLAVAAIDNGAAQKVLDKLIRLTNS